MADQPALLTAITITLTTIDNRIRLYRALVIYVIVAGLGSPLASVFVQSWIPLVGLGSIIPAVMIYLAIDARWVRTWADTLTTLSHDKKLDLGQFRQTIISFRHLPASTLNAMLALIPSKSTT